MSPSASVTFLGGAVAAGFVALSLQSPSAWPENLLQNPDGSAGTVGWSRAGDAAMGGAAYDGVFVLRNGGNLQQRVDLPPGSAGKFLVVVGRASSERVNADASISGLPYLYGMIYAGTGPQILSHLQGQSMRLRTDETNRWGPVSGVFPIPEGAGSVSIRMGQSARAGDAQDGSAARFDDLGLFVLPTDRRAHRFANIMTMFGPDNGRAVSLEPPADSTVREAFVPGMGVILPEDVAVDVATPCSRRKPGPVRGLWTPDAALVARVDAELAPLLQGALERDPTSRGRFFVPQYWRQFVGFVIDKRRVVYINGFVESVAIPGRPLPDWTKVAGNICDGGTRAFGAEFDVELGRITKLSFNSPR